MYWNVIAEKPHFKACTCSSLPDSEGPPLPMPPSWPHSCFFILQGWISFPPSPEAFLDFPPQSQLLSLCACFYYSMYTETTELCVDLHHWTVRSSRAEILFHLPVHNQFLDLVGAQHRLVAGQICLTEYWVDRFLFCLYVILSFSLSVLFLVFNWK